MKQSIFIVILFFTVAFTSCKQEDKTSQVEETKSDTTATIQDTTVSE